MPSSSDDSDDEFYDAKESPTNDEKAFKEIIVSAKDSRKSSFPTTSRQNSPTKPNRMFVKSQLSEESPFTRQRKLCHLRQKMLVEFDADATPRSSDVVGLGTEPDSVDSSSDLSSLASWGKHLLTPENVRQADNLIVKPLDTTSTKASVNISSNFPVKFPPPPTAPLPPPASASIVFENKSSSSSAGQSSESSKNSTLERFETPDSKTSSLERNLQISRSLSNKTGSLTRDISGISACDQFFYDNVQLAVLERKNSAAAEVIEALTSEIVRNVKLERNAMQKSAEKLMMEESDGGVDVGVSSQNFDEPDSIAKKVETEDDSVKKSVKQPDIITSNRVKSELSLDTNAFLPPLKPPRRKRLGSSNTPSTPGSPIVPGVSFMITPSDELSPVILELQNEEIDVLSNTTLKNLDTGELIPLNLADEKLPKCHPLSEYMKTLSSDYQRQSQSSLDSDTGSFISGEDLGSVNSFGSRDSYLSQAKQKSILYKKLLSKKVGRAVNKTVNKMKRVAEGVSHQFHNDETSQSEDEENSDNAKIIRIRASHKHKGPYHFEQVKLAQDLSGEHSGAVWCIKFSHCGRLLATAGQDNLIRVWVMKDAFNYFNDMKSRYNAEEAIISGVPFHEQLLKYAADVALLESGGKTSLNVDPVENIELTSKPSVVQDDVWAPFMTKPFCLYRGHSADVLDLSWSKNYFILSSSMDRTVRLWHISRTECLCCFQHIDFVTAIAFLPKDDRYFLSGSLDGKLRLWHIPEKKVALWNEVDGGKLVTTLTFARNGKFAVVGTYDGRCIFYSTEQLKYHTQIDVKSSHGKNSRPHKVTGLESYQDKLLVTSNDSRIRLYDLRDLSLTCKYKGYTNYSSQIRASFSHNGKYIVCGSEDKNIYLWKTTMDSDTLSLPVRKDRNRMWESIRAHNAVVTAAVFAPRPELIFQQIEWAKKRSIADSISGRTSSTSASMTNKHSPTKDSDVSCNGEVLVSADFSGAIHVFINKAKVKTGSSTFMPSY